jgi:thiol-disulfide isomerase/thioredoxin
MRLAAVGVTVSAWTASVALAGRCVLVEDFTATWCTPCIFAGDALGQLQDEHPNDIAVLQIHSYDGYTIPWGTTRLTSYHAFAGLPDVIFDGVLEKLGADAQIYPIYLGLFNTRLAVPSDVTVEVGGEQVSGQTFTFEVRVCLPSDGLPRPARVYLVRALDHYPAGGTHYRSCLMEAAAAEDIALVPGQCQVIQRSMTFDAVSWAHQADIRVLAWVEVPADAGFREVFQAVQVAWPFSPLPPLYQVGDINCDGSVDFNDINPFVLYLSNFGAWQAEFPTCPPVVGDINGDGTYGQASFLDINPFVALLSGR